MRIARGYMHRAIKSVGHSHMECGGKRSATPLWLVFVPYPSQDEPLKPKRRRASLAAALHKVPERNLVTPFRCTAISNMPREACPAMENGPVAGYQARYLQRYPRC